MDLVFILLIMIGGIGLLILELLAIPGTTIAGLCGVGLLVYGIYEVFMGYGMLWGVVAILIALVISIALLAYSLRTKTWKNLNSSLQT